MTVNKHLLSILLFSLFFIPISLVAQEAISTAGDHFENETGSISWTIGKLKHETYSTGEFVLTQGLHQPTVTVTGIANFPDLDLSLKAFPNPTQHAIQLAFTDGFKPSTFSANLLNVNGKIVQSQALNAATTDFDLSQLAAGTYFFQIRSKEQLVHTFKISKQ